MKIARICMSVLATLTFASIAAAQCGPARPKPTAGAGSLEEMIVAQENLIIAAIKARDAAAFKGLVDINGVVVNSGGIMKTSDAIPVLFGPNVSISEYTLENPQVKSIDKNTAIINYKSSGTATFEGKTAKWTSFDTTVFVRRISKWVAVFHQSSDMPQAPSTPADR